MVEQSVEQEDRGVGVRVPVGPGMFTCPYRPEDRPASYSEDTEEFRPKGKTGGA
jgi:hypothetical protein